MKLMALLLATNEVKYFYRSHNKTSESKKQKKEQNLQTEYGSIINNFNGLILRY